MCLNHARRQRRLKRIGEQWGDLHALAVNADSAMELPETSHQPQQGPANQPPPVGISSRAADCVNLPKRAQRP